MLAITVGLIFMALGLWGVAVWLPSFLIVLKGALPAMVFIGGVLAVIAGFTSLMDTLEARNTVRKKVEEKKEA